MNRLISLLLCWALMAPAQLFTSGGTALASFTPQATQTASVTISGTGTTNVINVSGEAGQLVGVDAIITTTVTGGGTTFLEVQVDSGTTTQYAMIIGGAANAGNPAGPGSNDGTNIHFIGCVNDGVVTGIGGSFSCFIGGAVQYKTSLRVGLNTTVAWTAGVVKLSAIRAVKG